LNDFIQICVYQQGFIKVLSITFLGNMNRMSLAGTSVVTNGHEEV